MRQFSCVSLLLLLGVLLAALHPSVAARRRGKHRSSPIMAYSRNLVHFRAPSWIVNQRTSLLNQLISEYLIIAAFGDMLAFRRRVSELLAAATGDQGLGQARAESILTDVDEETTTRGRRRVDEWLNYRRFRTRKNNPSSSHAHFGGRIPFTSDYGRVKRHPPKHN
jgi:hypothetical protein